MKRMLLAATAASTLACAAVAAGAGEARAQEGFELQIGGFYNALVIVRDADRLAGQKFRSYDFNQRGRYRIQGSQTLDSGLTVGFDTQYEMQAGMNNNRSYVYARGGFGNVQFGTMYSAPYLLHVSPPTAGWGIDDTGHAQGLPGIPFMATPTYYINRAMNFTYMTPRFGGFQAGFTFAPDQRNNVNMNNRVATNLSLQNATATGTLATDLQNIVGLSANFRQSFDEFSLALSAGVETGKWNRGADNALTALGRDTKRAWTVGVGANLGFGALNGGVAYNYDNQGMSGARVHQLTAGITYSIDGFTFGPSFGTGWTRGSVTGNNRAYIYEFGARYAFAPGVNLVGSVEHGRTRGPAFTNRKATAGLFGVQFSF